MNVMVVFINSSIQMKHLDPKRFIHCFFNVVILAVFVSIPEFQNLSFFGLIKPITYKIKYS